MVVPQKTPDKTKPDSGVAAVSEENAVVEEKPAPMTGEQHVERLERSRNLIKNHVIASLSTGLVPIPVVDLVLLSGIQLKMMSGLAKIYGLEFKKSVGKATIASLLGGYLPALTAMPVVSILKSVPLLGPTAVVTSVSLLGAAATYATGQVFLQHFESGGTFLTFKPDQVRAFFAQEFEKGKELAAEIKAAG